MTRQFRIFFDGTWSEADDRHLTNVAKLNNGVGPNLHTVYFPGVGSGWLPVTGALFGVGLAATTKRAYEWLREKRPTREDEVIVVGFSRGAYTARDFCAWLFLVGLRPGGKVDELYDDYVEKRRDRHTATAVALTPRVRHLLCFDTVGALGVPSPLGYTTRDAELHATDLTPNVRAATHYVAADETRRHFSPTLFPAGDRRVSELWCPGTHGDVGGGHGETFFSDRALSHAAATLHAEGVPFLPEFFAHLNAKIAANTVRKMAKSKSSFFLPDKRRVMPANAVKCPWWGDGL